MKVLITAPSLDENRNVSGISTVVRQIIEYGQSEFVHFAAGREDREHSGAMWLIRQILLPIRFLQHIRSTAPDLVHINTAMTTRAVFRDAVLAWAARFAGKPVMVSIHGGENLLVPFKSTFVENIAGRMLERSELVVLLNGHESEVVLKRFPGIKPETLPNAVPTDAAMGAREENRVPVIVFLGRLHDSKGIGEILAACIMLRDRGVEFVFRAFGDGDRRDWFVEAMNRHLGDSFEYGGVVSGHEKWSALRQADIFVLPSAFEGLSMALLEAMAAGCVVVASNIESISAVIRDGENGYLVPPQDSSKLAKILERLLADRSDWKKVRENAVESIRRHYSIERYIIRLESFYSEAAKGK